MVQPQFPPTTITERFVPPPRKLVFLGLPI